MPHDPYDECAVCGRFHYTHGNVPPGEKCHEFVPRAVEHKCPSCARLRADLASAQAQRDAETERANGLAENIRFALRPRIDTLRADLAARDADLARLRDRCARLEAGIREAISNVRAAQARGEPVPDYAVKEADALEGLDAADLTEKATAAEVKP